MLENIYKLLIFLLIMADSFVLAALSALSAGAILLLFVIIVWSLVWKGIALWKAAKKKSLVWFILLLVVNTLGILEILYIFLFSKISLDSKKKKKKIR